MTLTQTYILLGVGVVIYAVILGVTFYRMKTHKNNAQILYNQVSALKFKLWDAELKLKNARDHTELLEHDNAVFLRREIDRIKNRNKPTAVVVEESAMNFAMHAECKRLEKELALSRVQIKDLEECNSRLYAKSIEKSDECAARRCESQTLKGQLEELVTESKRIKDSLFSQVTALRAENYALKMKLSPSPSEREREQLRTANKDLTERLQAMYDSNVNKYEEYKVLSNEVCILKKTVADLMKDNVELKDQAESLGKDKTYLTNLIEALTKDNRRLRESWSNKGNSSNYRGTTF